MADAPGLPPVLGADRAAAASRDDPLADYDYELPRERIAQHPAPERDAARLYVLDRSGASHHARVRDLPDWLRAGDLLVVNETRVVPARPRPARSGGPMQRVWSGIARCGICAHFVPHRLVFSRRTPTFREGGERANFAGTFSSSHVLVWLRRESIW